MTETFRLVITSTKKDSAELLAAMERILSDRDTMERELTAARRVVEAARSWVTMRLDGRLSADVTHGLIESVNTYDAAVRRHVVPEPDDSAPVPHRPTISRPDLDAAVRGEEKDAAAEPCPACGAACVSTVVGMALMHRPDCAEWKWNGTCKRKGES